MQRVGRNRWGQRLLFGAHLLGLLAIFYFYVLLRIQPHLLYCQSPSVFLVDYTFFAGFLDRPGGPVEYVSAFLSPMLAYDWLGALILTLLATLVCLATHQLCMAIAITGNSILSLIPAVLVLVLLVQYIHPVELCVGLVVVLVLANVYVRMVKTHDAVRLAAFLIASAIAYHAAGVLYLVFACLCSVFEWGVKRCRPLGALCLLCAALVPIAGARLFDLNISQAYRGLMLSYEHWLAVPSSVPIALTMLAGLLLYFPIVAIALVRRRGRTGSPAPNSPSQTCKKSSAKAGDASDSQRSSIRLAARSAMLVASLVVADIVLFDFSKKCLLQMVCSVEQEEWADALTHVDRLPASDARWLDLRTGFHVNRALYFNGDLLDRMFGYPQTVNGPTLALVRESATSMAQTTPRQCSEILFELGRINESEHMAYEALEVYGCRPRILKRLVYINVLKGRPEAARRFVALLERSLLHSEWARRCNRQLDMDPTLSSLPEVVSRRELMVVRDSVDDIDDLEKTLKGLLNRNPRNRMAFEYLMAHYLLTQQVDKLAANLHRFEDFDETRLPRHCQEALAVHLTATGSRETESREQMVSSKTWRRQREFMRAVQQFSGDEAPKAFAELHADFGDSYFFFHVFGRNRMPSN